MRKNFLLNWVHDLLDELVSLNMPDICLLIVSQIKLVKNALFFGKSCMAEFLVKIKRNLLTQVNSLERDAVLADSLKDKIKVKICLYF